MVVVKSYRSLVELIELAGLIPHRDRICCSIVSVQYSLLSRINCHTASRGCMKSLGGPTGRAGER